MPRPGSCYYTIPNVAIVGKVYAYKLYKKRIFELDIGSHHIKVGTKGLSASYIRRRIPLIAILKLDRFKNRIFHPITKLARGQPRIHAV